MAVPFGSGPENLELQDFANSEETSANKRELSPLIRWLESLVSIQTGLSDNNVAEGLDHNFKDVASFEHPDLITTTEQDKLAKSGLQREGFSTLIELGDFLKTDNDTKKEAYDHYKLVGVKDGHALVKLVKDGVEREAKPISVTQDLENIILAEIQEKKLEQLTQVTRIANRAENANKVDNIYKPIGDNSEEFAKTLISSTRTMLEKLYAENNRGRKFGLKAKESLERLKSVTNYEEYLKFSESIDFGSLNLQRLQLAKEALSEPEPVNLTRRSFIEGGLTTFVGLGLGFMANKLMSANPPTPKNLSEADIIAEPEPGINRVESWLQRKNNALASERQQPLPSWLPTAIFSILPTVFLSGASSLAIENKNKPKITTESNKKLQKTLSIFDIIDLRNYPYKNNLKGEEISAFDEGVLSTSKGVPLSEPQGRAIAKAKGVEYINPEN
jgi:hypothetical protein